MDILGQSALLVAVTSFALGFSVLSRNVKNKLYLSFAMISTLISTWALAFFLERIWPDAGFYRLHLFCNILLSPVCLTFIRIMVRIQDRMSRLLLDISLALAVLLSVTLAFHLERISILLQLVYFSPGLIFLQTLQLMWIDHQLRKGVPKLPKIPTVGLGRRTLIYIGALVVLACSVMDHVPWMGQTLPAIGNLALMAYLFFLSQAITQQRFLNVSSLVSRFLVWLVVALTLTILYLVLVAWIENSPGLFFLNSFIASFLILMLLDPLRSLVTTFTQRLLTQKHRKLQSSLSEAKRELIGIVERGNLFQEILSAVERFLQPETASLFILRNDGTKYRRVRSLGKDSSIKEVLAQHPMLQYSSTLASQGKFPVLLDQALENEIDRSASKTQREWQGRVLEGLKALNSNILIPFFDAGKILGFVSLRVASPPEPWGNNWGLLPIIYPYFEDVAQTLQSMEVYTRQKEKDRLAALGEMAAGLAHEIRNPLGAIRGAAQLLNPDSNQENSHFLKIIIEEVDRLNRVVTQFLDYSKPPLLSFHLFNLTDLARKTIEMMRPSIRQGVDLEFQSTRSPARVLGSAEQIQQVLMNLILNAAKALEAKPTGMIRVSVEVEQEEVSLIVEDTGRGIKKENLEKLFIPFFTTSPGGTGLGLSISHKIVELHRGRIEAVSEEGRFTRFSVILPLNKEA